MVKITFLLL